jgi:NADH-quinone oxidoreductase subunit N
LAGTVAMVSLKLSYVLLGIEVLSIALYILAASNRLSLKVTSWFKVFLDGIFASGIILFLDIQGNGKL